MLEFPQKPLSLLIIIPTRGNQPKIKDVLRNIDSNIKYLVSSGFKVDCAVVVSINGFKYPNECKLITEIEVGNIPVETLVSNTPGKVNAILQACQNRSPDFLITLDDDICFERQTFFLALNTLLNNSAIELVGFQSKIIAYSGNNVIRKLIHDIININLLISLYNGCDPFLFGRFIALRGASYPVPAEYIVDDIYLSLFYQGKYIIRPEFVYSYGKDSLLEHSKRVIMLESARRQAKINFPKEWEISRNECKRDIHWPTLLNVSLYYKICYLLYTVLRFVTNRILAKVFRKQSVQW